MRRDRSGGVFIFDMCPGHLPAILPFPDGRPNRFAAGDVITGGPNMRGLHAQSFGDGGLYVVVGRVLDLGDGSTTDPE